MRGGLPGGLRRGPLGGPRGARGRLPGRHLLARVLRRRRPGEWHGGRRGAARGSRRCRSAGRLSVEGRRPRAAGRDGARRGSRRTRRRDGRRHQPAGAAAPEPDDHPRQLVFDVSGAPPRGGPLPLGARLSAGRRCAPAQPGRRPGDEHRHRRRDQPGLEARRRVAPPRGRESARHVRAGADRVRAPAGGYHRSDLHDRARRGSGGRARADDRRAAPTSRGVSAASAAALCVRDCVAARDRVSAQPAERGDAGRRGGWGSAAVGADGGGPRQF